MSDVFISYSRKDKPFAERLFDRLKEAQRDIWIDWDDIPLTADWWKEIQSGIEGTNTFVFLISPDSATSEVCRQEIEYAVTRNKRLIPLLCRSVEQERKQGLLHPAISSHNWIIFTEEVAFEQAFQMLLLALDTDLSYVREHTRLLVRAREWESKNRDTSLLLSRGELSRAELWLVEGGGKSPKPSELHALYVLKSRQNATRRERIIFGIVTVLFAISVLVAGLSWIFVRTSQGNLRYLERRIKDERATAEQVQVQMVDDLLQLPTEDVCGLLNHLNANSSVWHEVLTSPDGRLLVERQNCQIGEGDD
jgi:hypothetical protein